MNKKQAKKLFIKYINNECSLEELQLLETFLDSYQDKNKTWPVLKLGNEDAFNKNSWSKIESQINKRQKKKNYPFRLYLKYVAAASVLLFVAFTIFLNKEDNTSQFFEPIIVNNQIQTGTDKATLTLEHGEEVTLLKGASFQTPHAISNGKEITYNNNSSQQLVYNYLTIPRGGEFQLTLSDGTQVWLNSESQLKYPVSFTDGENRQIELVYGEAYFDVSPSTEHNGAKFKVFNNNQEVEVLGTQFNIKAYKDESNIYTTLVEGKVSINTANQNKILAPTEQANLDMVSNTISISTVDVYNEISWKEGIFSFEDKTLKDLMQVLARWYDMEVQFENKDLEDIKFLGKLKKSQSIEEILIAIKNSSIINNFEISNKTIILK